jgi:hypothetical protein
MSCRFIGSVSVTAILMMVPAAAQSQSALAKPAATKSDKAWTPPRTPDGKPDLGGVWSFATLTPLERPAEFAGKAYLTDKEAAEFAKRNIADRNKDSREGSGSDADVARAYNDAWWDFGKNATNQTSLVIDPPDGKLPPLTAEGQKRKAEREEARNRPARGPEDRSVGERCILGFNSGPPMMPSAYNNNVQIFQSGNTVVLLNEMVHNARVVPMDGRPHGTVRQWVGDSRGHWEGNTLVVDTVNFTDVGTGFRGIPTDLNYHLIERFTLRDANTLVYEFTVDDPTMQARPWTASVPMVRSNEAMYEYACHEGNYGMVGILAGARAEEDAAQKAAKPGSK